MMKITGLSHLFKWENLHNWWLTKYFFCPTVCCSKNHLHVSYCATYCASFKCVFHVKLNKIQLILCLNKNSNRNICMH